MTRGSSPAGSPGQSHRSRKIVDPEHTHMAPPTGPIDPTTPIVPCRVPALGNDVGTAVQAAASYSLVKPPRMGRCRIRARIGSGTVGSGRGGRSSSDRCGRFRLSCTAYRASTPRRCRSRKIGIRGDLGRDVVS
jgi:hypothetical protein